MTKSKFILPILIGLFMAGNADAKFYEGYDNECWCDDGGSWFKSDEYWFCGAQTQSCRDNKANKKNKKTGTITTNLLPIMGGHSGVVMAH